MKHYFATDGSYGEALPSFIVCPTDNWTDEDWEAIDEAGDGDRLNTALAINSFRRRQK